MLKTYITWVQLPKRLKLASATAATLDASPDRGAVMPQQQHDHHLQQQRHHHQQHSPQQQHRQHTTSATMTAEASVPPPPRPQQMLASQRAKQQKESPTQPPAGDGSDSQQRGLAGARFPLGYKEAAYQWWTSISSRQAERNVLSFIPYLREAGAETTTTTGSQLQSLAQQDPFGQRQWRSSMVQLSGKNRALNEFAVERVGEQADDTLVMLHGYGAGLGFFYKNFEPLTRVPGWRLFALDMLGMGNSARPPFKVRAKDPKEKIAEAEAWFVDSLEEWRKIRKIEKFTLLGHSLGGYLAVSYALKYPGHLNKLILASPAGIPEDPWAVSPELPEPTESTMASEFVEDQESIVSHTKAGDNNNFLGARDKRAAAAANPDTPPKRPIPGWLVWLWDANVSPFSIVRLAGPFGPRVVSGWTSRRFNHLPQEEKDTLHTYSYSLFRQRGSGEYALPYILAPGAYARSPVIHRIQEVGRQVLKPATEDGQPAVRETGIPIVFMYGENDWMDVAGGYAAEEKVKQRVVKALLHGTDEEKRRERGSAKVVVVPRAGHHLYIDNPEVFNELVRKELEDTRAQGLRDRAAEA